MSDPKRIRPRLLVLLWIWALLMFVVVDLFRNVPEFDRVRPTWRTYRDMRLAAHRLIREPIDFVAEAPLPSRRVLHAALTRVERYEDLGSLTAAACDPSRDPRVRGRAMRLLAERDAAQARIVLAGLAYDDGESVKVRAAAARYLARAGDVAGAERLADDSSRMVRRGARTGLAELGTAAAARALLGRGDDAAVALVFNADAIPVLAEAAPESAAACRALGNTKSVDAVAPLVAVLQRKGAHPAVRSAAAQALGRLGRREAIESVTAACADVHAPVARDARLARQRLAHRN